MSGALTLYSKPFYQINPLHLDVFNWSVYNSKEFVTAYKMPMDDLRKGISDIELDYSKMTRVTAILLLANTPDSWKVLASAPDNVAQYLCNSGSRYITRDIYNCLMVNRDVPESIKNPKLTLYEFESGMHPLCLCGVSERVYFSQGHKTHSSDESSVTSLMILLNTEDSWKVIASAPDDEVLTALEGQTDRIINIVKNELLVVGREELHEIIGVDTTSTQYCAEIFQNIVLVTYDSKLLKDMYIANSLFRNALDREDILQQLAQGFATHCKKFVETVTAPNTFGSFTCFIRWIDFNFYSAESVRAGVHRCERNCVDIIIKNNDVEVLKECVGRISTILYGAELFKISRSLADVFIQHALTSDKPGYAATAIALSLSVIRSNLDTIKKIEDTLETMIEKRILSHNSYASGAWLYDDISQRPESISMHVGLYHNDKETMRTRRAAMIWFKWSLVLLLRETYDREVQSYIIRKILTSTTDEDNLKKSISTAWKVCKKRCMWSQDFEKDMIDGLYGRDAVALGVYLCEEQED